MNGAPEAETATAKQKQRAMDKIFDILLEGVKSGLTEEDRKLRASEARECQTD